MFYKAVCIINTYAFCRTMFMINKLANRIKPPPTIKSGSVSDHQSFISSLQFIQK